MSVINTNISGLIGLNNLRLTNLGLKTSLERLSSGLRINKAADDPSGLAIAKGMEAQIGGIRTAIQNGEDGINLVHTADGALSETQNILLRMRDLAVRAANEATLTSSDIHRLNNEFLALKSEINRKSLAVSFNTKVLFSGGFTSGQVLQIGPDNGTNFRLTIQISTVACGTLFVSAAWQAAPTYSGTLSSVSLLSWGGVATTGMTSASQMAIDFVNASLNHVSDVRAALGIQERRLNHIINDLKAEDINISAAKSRIYDADMAVEISEFTRLQILQQTGTAILAQANAQPQSVLQLLK